MNLHYTDPKTLIPGDIRHPKSVCWGLSNHVRQNYGEQLVSDSQLIPSYFADEQPTAADQESSSDDVKPTVPRDPIGLVLSLEKFLDMK